MPDEPKVQEVLYLSNEGMEGGLILLRELKFFDNLTVYGRISRREDNTECPWESTIWALRGVWKNLKQLQGRADKCRQEGGTVVWNPLFDPATIEFRKEVRF